MRRSGRRQRRGFGRLGKPLLAIVGVALVAWLLVRGAGGPDLPPVPDPVTPEMPGPVRRSVVEARETLLADLRSAEAWGRYGMVLDANDFYPEALVAYEAAWRLDPTSFRWAYLRAVMMDFTAAETEPLVAAFEEALRLSPKFPPGHLRFGDALMRKGLFEEARRAYAQAAVLDPDFSLAHRGLGQAFLALDQAEPARQSLERSVEIQPADGAAWAALANAYELTGRPEKAEEARAKSAQLEPVKSVPDPVRFEVDSLSRIPTEMQDRVQQLRQQGDHAAALRDLQMIAESMPDNARNQRDQGEVLLELKRIQEAEAAFRKALELDPAVQRAHDGLARILAATGRLPEAVAEYRKAVEARPDDIELQASLGILLAQTGDLEGAIERFAKAAELGADDVQLHHDWGTALLRLNRLEEAAAHFERALEVSPDSPDTHYNLGIALRGLGRNDEALAHFRQAVVLRPGHLAARELPADDPGLAPSDPLAVPR